MPTKPSPTEIRLARAPSQPHYQYPYGVENSAPCPFCTLPPERVLFRNGSAIAFRDAYPVSAGHTLVIPQRHVASLFDTTPD